MMSASSDSMMFIGTLCFVEMRTVCRLVTFALAMLSLTVDDALTKNGKLMGFLDKFQGVCPGTEKQVKGAFKDIKIYTQPTGQVAIDYEVHFKEQFPSSLTSVWKIQKCSSRENPDSCMPFSTVKTRQFCRFLVKSKATEAWSGFIECMQPAFQCPFKKRVYIGKNCTYDASLFSFFPLDGFFWKFRVEVFHPRSNALLMCFNMDGGVTTKY